MTTITKSQVTRPASTDDENQIPCQPRGLGFTWLIFLTVIELLMYYWQNITFKSYLHLYSQDQKITPENAPIETQIKAWKCTLYFLGANTTPPIMYKY